MNVLVIVVIYNKQISEIEYLSSLKDSDILIYDNSLKPQSPPTNIYYYHNPQNAGVSMAYNYGKDLAIKLKKEFLIILDQDTTFNQGILETYSQYANEYGHKYIYAPIVKNGERIYSPFVDGRYRNHPQNMSEFNYEKKYNIEGKSLINSGLMIPLEVMKDVGNYNENIKLDFSDIYFIEKYKKIYSDIILMDIYLEHKLSGDEGKNKQKELMRYRYYCNGAKEFKRTSSNKFRIYRLVFFRMLRLVTKYRTLTPLTVTVKYFFGGYKA